jgi:hypothetical protein
LPPGPARAYKEGVKTIPATSLDQQRIRSQLIYVVLTAAMVLGLGLLTHDRALFVPCMALASGWMASIFMFHSGPLALWRIVTTVVIQGILWYGFHLYLARMTA